MHTLESREAEFEPVYINYLEKEGRPPTSNELSLAVDGCCINDAKKFLYSKELVVRSIYLAGQLAVTYVLGLPLKNVTGNVFPVVTDTDLTDSVCVALSVEEIEKRVVVLFAGGCAVLNFFDHPLDIYGDGADHIEIERLYRLLPSIENYSHSMWAMDMIDRCCNILEVDRIYDLISVIAGLLASTPVEHRLITADRLRAVCQEFMPHDLAISGELV